MAVLLSPVGGVAAQFFDNDGNVLSGGKIYTYAAGTTTPQTTYTTSLGNIAHANPIILDSAGRVPTGEIWLTDGFNYKFVLKDANDTLIATYDNISGINSNFVAYTNSQEIQTATAGQTVFTLTTMQYQPATNSLSVFVDGVNQYGPGAQYSYVETDSTTVTFNAGLHIGAEVKFTTSQQQGAGAVNASQVSYTPAGTGAVTTNVQAKLRQYLSAKDFGVVGDGLTDDWLAFSAACAAAVLLGQVLSIQGLKIYLGSQNASIPSEGLYLLGSGIPQPDLNWDYMTGTNNQFSVVRSSVLSQDGSIIISRYNGAIFTGKTFSGENFAVMGDPSQSSSSCFDTGVPSVYPGWSQSLKQLHKFGGYYFGNDGFKLQGGLEVVALYDVSMNYCNGYCLHIYQTSGIDSPIEYIDWNDSSFTYGLLGNVLLDGARKHIKLDNLLLNNPNQLARRAAGGFVVTSEADIVYGAQIVKDPNITVMQDITVIDCYAEETQGIAYVGGLMNSVNVQRNYLLAYNNTWPYYHAKFDSQAYNIRTSENTSPSGVRMYFTPGQHSSSEGIYLNEKWDSAAGFVQNGQSLTGSQIRPGLMTTVSQEFGDGTAASFTVNLATLLPWGTIGNSESSKFSAFLISANWQASNADTIGAYLIYVTKMPSGNFIGIVQSTGTTTGFSSAPTLSTAGVLTVPLSVSYRGRVTRLDLANILTY